MTHTPTPRYALSHDSVTLRKRRDLLREELRRVEAQMVANDPLVHPDDCRGCQSWEAPVHPYEPPSDAPTERGE